MMIMVMERLTNSVQGVLWTNSMDVCWGTHVPWQNEEDKTSRPKQRNQKPDVDCLRWWLHNDNGRIKQMNYTSTKRTTITDIHKDNHLFDKGSTYTFAWPPGDSNQYQLTCHATANILDSCRSWNTSNWWPPWMTFLSITTTTTTMYLYKGRKLEFYGGFTLNQWNSIGSYTFIESTGKNQLNLLLSGYF